MNKFLIIGGVRSGKSSYAELLAKNLTQSCNESISYVATAEAVDEEMTQRIASHQNRRDASWQLHECVTELTQCVSAINGQDIILIDCLTLWLNNCLYYPECDWQQQKNSFLSWLSTANQPIILVSNEVGFSITPNNALARQFADQQGWLNQDVARLVDSVTLTIAGIPHAIK